MTTSYPTPEFDLALPINQRREEITEAIRDNQVIILCGETGSGKTTQIPKICLTLGLGQKKKIGHTQPRRIAARTVAARIAEELHSELGERVGYKIRFNDKSRAHTQIKLMTDGILLNEIQSDPLLKKYDTIIIDEAHERSLNIDFLLGYLKRILPKRRDLKLIVTSATIDPQRFSRHFGDAPVLEVSGRTFPVTVRYRPLEHEEQEEEKEQIEGIYDATLELAREGPGDILVFLSTEREIRETAEFLNKQILHSRSLTQTEITPLFSRLSIKEQNEAFKPHSGRRIVLATNVAETSLTIPGIRYVVDTGKARISRYSHQSSIQRLPIEKVSQAAANQRKGRCGRVQEGICIRLYSEEDFNDRPLFTDAEIVRTHLAPVILQMAALRLGAPDEFPFIDPPDLKLIRNGYRTLFELGAVRQDSSITKLGNKLSRFPVDPKIARMLIAADRERSLTEVLVIASALTIQNPRERPFEKQQAADEKHEQFVDEKSDFLFYLNLWRFFQAQKKKLSNSQLRKLCKTNFLSWMRMREWQEVHRQLKQISEQMGLKQNDQEADYGMIHRALLAGLLGNIATQSSEKHVYQGARNSQLKLWPGSGQFKKNPKWIVAATRLETSQVFAHTVAQIDPMWIERLANHLVKHSYAEPHWEKKRGQVAAFETVTLYGIPIVMQRKINYGPIDPKESRKLFIRHGLVEGEIYTRGQFFELNRKEIAAIENMEAKARRRDLLVDDEVLYHFYDARIPEHIYSTPHFEKWRKEVEQEAPHLLLLTREKLLRQEDHPTIASEQFPEHLDVEGLQLPLHYHFDPSSEDDGVTLTVPMELLQRLKPEPFAWLIPGLLEEKVIALIRTLPKALRKNFVPVPDFAAACLAILKPGSTPLIQQIGKKLTHMVGVPIPDEAWDESQLPQHLRMNFRIVDTHGNTVQQGCDLLALQRNPNPQFEHSGEKNSEQSGKSGKKGKKRGKNPKNQQNQQNQQSKKNKLEEKFTRETVETWDFDELPETIEVERYGFPITLYPALVKNPDHPEKIALQLLETHEQAVHAHRDGFTALFLKTHWNALQKTVKQAVDLKTLCLHYTALGTCEALTRELLNLAAQESFRTDTAPRNEVDFQTLCKQGLAEIGNAAAAHAKEIAEILKRFHQLNRQLKSPSPANLLTYKKIKEHLDRLVFPGFLTQTPPERLAHFPRYLRAIETRLKKLGEDPKRDQMHEQSLTLFWNRWQERAGESQTGKQTISTTLDDFRWMLEEFRVSLFAQNLGTAQPVSAKRLEKQWREVVMKSN